MSWRNDLRALLERILHGSRSASDRLPDATCHEAAAHIYEWLDGELEGGEAVRIGAHLETCAHCYPMLVFERSFLEAVARAGKLEPGSEALRERVLSSLRAEGYTAP